MQSILEHTKTMLKPLKNKINNDLKKHYEQEKKNVEEQIVHLVQIKIELEAWQVVKEELQIVFKGKNHYGEPLRRYELNVIGQNKIDTLNKALEVEDND